MAGRLGASTRGKGEGGMRRRQRGEWAGMSMSMVGLAGGARSGHYRASIRALKQGQNKQFVCCVFTRD